MLRSKFSISHQIVLVGVLIQVCLVWQLVKAQTIIPPDPCPMRVVVASFPCVTSEPIYQNCDSAPNCNGEYADYVPERKNTDTAENKNSETWTTSTTYVLPNGYQCASIKVCWKYEDTEECEAMDGTEYGFGKIYAQHSCNP
jgi:hypothetical protein